MYKLSIGSGSDKRRGLDTLTVAILGSVGDGFDPCRGGTVQGAEADLKRCPPLWMSVTVALGNRLTAPTQSAGTECRENNS